MSYVADRLAAVKPSASMAVSMAAKALRAQGVDVIDLGLGEPDFPTPAHVVEAAFKAAAAGETLYTASAGTPTLRAAIADKFARENGLSYSADEITVANGAKQIIFNALLATLNPGDEAILPTPYFVSYPEMVKLLGGTPITPACPAETGFRLTPEVLEAAITPRTKWLFLNMPGNPSGAVYSATELQALGAVLARHPHILILSDEIYEHILFDGRKFVSFGAACPDLRDRSLIVNGVAKAYAMTGWRVGYAAGPRDVIAAMNTVQLQATGGICTVAQAAAVAVLDGPQDLLREQAEIYRQRRDLVLELLSRARGIECHKPSGAFYIYANIAGLIGRRTAGGATIASDLDFVTALLGEKHVATVHGGAYGMSPYFRLSYATDFDSLREACSRIVDFCNTTT